MVLNALVALVALVAAALVALAAAALVALVALVGKGGGSTGGGNKDGGGSTGGSTGGKGDRTGGKCRQGAFFTDLPPLAYNFLNGKYDGHPGVTFYPSSHSICIADSTFSCEQYCTSGAPIRPTHSDGRKVEDVASEHGCECRD